MFQYLQTEIDLHASRFSGLCARLLERHARLQADVERHRAQLVEPSAATSNTLRIGPETAAAARAGAHPIRFTITAAGKSETLVEKSTFIVPR